MKEGCVIVIGVWGFILLNAFAIYLTCAGQEKAGYALFLAICGAFSLIMYAYTKTSRNARKRAKNNDNDKTRT